MYCLLRRFYITSCYVNFSLSLCSVSFLYMHYFFFFFLFFFNATATTEIYTLSLHDALPISKIWVQLASLTDFEDFIYNLKNGKRLNRTPATWMRSEEHTSELQSHSDLVCRLLLEKQKTTYLSNDNQYHIY